MSQIVFPLSKLKWPAFRPLSALLSHSNKKSIIYQYHPIGSSLEHRHAKIFCSFILIVENTYTESNHLNATKRMVEPIQLGTILHYTLHWCPGQITLTRIFGKIEVDFHSVCPSLPEQISSLHPRACRSNLIESERVATRLHGTLAGTLYVTPVVKPNASLVFLLVVEENRNYQMLFTTSMVSERNVDCFT